MIHGDCSSVGCYAMTDEQIGEIYSLARDAFLGGQPSFQIQAYPFRMTPANLARHRTNPHMAFWKMLKIGNDHFEATHLEPKVDVCDRRYVFDAQQPPKSIDAPRVRSDRQLPRFRRQSGNRTAGAGEATRRRGPVRAIGQSQRAGRPNPQRTGWRNEQGFPRPVSGRTARVCHQRIDRRSRTIPNTDNNGSLASNFSAPCSDRSPPHRRKSPGRQRKKAARIRRQPDRRPRRRQSPRRRARSASLQSRRPATRPRRRRRGTSCNRPPRRNRFLCRSPEPTRPRRRRATRRSTRCRSCPSRSLVAGLVDC